MVTISNDKLTVKVAKRGAEIRAITDCGGTEYIWDGNPAVWSKHAPILFPICGGLKEDRYILGGKEYKLPKHGFASFQHFEVESLGDTAVTFLLRENEETLKCYPYSFELRVIYELEGDSLKCTYAVKNKSENTMYFSVGAHEGYACPGGIEGFKVIFEKPEDLNTVVVDGNFLTEDYITIKKNATELELIYDYFSVDALVFRNIKSKKVALTNGKREITVEYNDFKNLLLWTMPGAEFFCIEPWTGLPDIVGSSFDFSEKADNSALDSGAEKKIVHTMTFKNIG